MAAVEAVARVDVEEVAIDQRRAVGTIVRPGPRLPGDIEQPEDVRVEGRDFTNQAIVVVGIPRNERRVVGDERRAAVGGHVPGFIPVGSIVAVGLPCDIETHHLVAVREHVDPVAFDRDGRADARPGPVEVGIGPELGDDQLPQEVAVLLVEAQQHAAIAFVPRVTGQIVVRPDEDPALGHDGRRPRLAAQGDHPLDVLAGGGVEAVHQAGLRGDHVPRERLAPLGLVARPRG